MSIKKIVIASGNEHKVAEFQSIFKPLGIKVVPYKDVVKADFVMPEETGTTFEENAIIKAEAIAKEVGLPVFADDSGFCVKSLDDFPGIRSARFAEEVGGYTQAFAEIEKRLGGKYADAQFVCVIAFANVAKKGEKADKTKTFRGVCNGFVTFPARGENGFGYDPIFVPNSYGVTFAEMSEDEKNMISHRAAASALFVKYVEELKASEEANRGKRVVSDSFVPVDASVNKNATESGKNESVKGESSNVAKSESDVLGETFVLDVKDDNYSVREKSVAFDGGIVGESDDVVEKVSANSSQIGVQKSKSEKKPVKEKREKTGMAAFLDVDKEFDAPAVPFSSGDDVKIEE